MNDVIEFTPGYLINRDGEVYSLNPRWPSRGIRKMKLHPNDHGYLHVGCRVQGRTRFWVIHRLVARTFLGERPSARHEVRHLNGNQHDNRADNLAWGTSKENAADKQRHGTMARGVRNGAAKIQEHQVIEIWQHLQAGTSQRTIARLYGISQTNVRGIGSGKIWKHLQLTDCRAKLAAEQEEGGV